MLILTPEVLPTIFVETQFTDTIVAMEESVDFEGNTYSNLANVIMVTSNPQPLTNINVSFAQANVGIVTISGAFSLDLFPETQIKYITRGKSDLEEKSVTVSSFNQIPAGKQVFDYSAPTTSSVDVTFTLTSNNNFTTQITKTIEYNYDIGRLKLLEYI
jgi:hypothetical protein